MPEGETKSDTAGRKKTAIVLSGGGANGAYEVGILKALLNGQSPTTNYQPLEPDIFSGTSIGSFNAAFLVSQWDRYGSAAVSNLEQVWLDEMAGTWRKNGVFRVIGNPLDLLSPESFIRAPFQRAWDGLREVGGLTWEAVQRGVDVATSSAGSLEQRLVEAFNLSSFISTDPMHRMLERLDYQGIRQSRKWLKVAAVNWMSGQLRMFWNHDFTDRFGPKAIRASASLPGFFPPVEWGSQAFCDGSVLLNTPLSPAIHAGADILHVIYLDPDITTIPLPPLQNTFDTMLRMMQIKWAETYNDDIGDAARINRGIEAFRAFERELPANASEDGLRALRELSGVAEKMRPLTIFRYHPRDPFEGHIAFLNFEHDRIEALIARGFEDAVHHDFDESGDVFPVGQERPPNPRFVA